MKRSFRMSLRALSLLLSSLSQIAFASESVPEKSNRTLEPGTPEASSVFRHATQKVLKNGLRVTVLEDHHSPLVSVNLYYHVGSKNETRERNGFAHLFEHLMFQGSKNVPEDTFFKTLESAGGTGINGSTNDDRTNYHETVPPHRLELALWLESDRMGFLLEHVDQATFESQREVVKNERRQNYENAPYGLSWSFLREAMYPVNHPYHFLTIGTPEDLDKASLEDVRTFFRTHYIPANASLVMVGDVKAEDAFLLAEKYFGTLYNPEGKGRSVLPSVPEVELRQEKVLHADAGVSLAKVYMSWNTPAFFKKGDAELDILGNALSKGKSSRLYRRLVDGLRSAQDIVAYQASKELSSEFQIVATVSPGHTPEELAVQIDSELEKLKAEGLQDEEIQRAQASIYTSQVFDTESFSSRAEDLNKYIHFTNDYAYFSKDVARYKNVKKEEIKALATKYLDKEKRVLLYVHPKEGAPICGVLRGGAK